MLENATIDEVRKFYSVFANPSCTNVDSLAGSQNGDAEDPAPVSDEESASRLKRAAESTPEGNHECSEWIYDFDFLFGYHSMTSELNWVCQNAWKSIMGQSTYFIGSVVGTLALGVLADVIGRLPVLIMAHAAGILGNGLTILATDEISFAICRFISGLATDNNFVMMYILVMEYIAPRMRTFGLNLCIGVFYCLGSVVTPWLAVWLGNWKLYLVATIVPALVVPLFYFIIPESAQWLISRNKVDKALVCYQRIAKFNRKQLDESFVDDFKSVVSDINERRKDEDEHPSVIALFKTPRLRRLTMILFFKS
jgi:MFS transporter, OCT family, solute carrier family 22 (organic cation transporter), member 4/5